ncbi:hypothetical protein IBX38_00530 [Candidatus Bathyarchaeota archaeon]|nr:hypothetical protein [Candidatus Bathyarchaeota archaeon]
MVKIERFVTVLFKLGVSSAGSASSDPKSRVSLIVSSFALEAINSEAKITLINITILE